jgi:RsiW-degrading membrane proteinase PrsW (M82 family)
LGITFGFGVVYLIGSGFDMMGMTKTVRAFLIPVIEEVAKLLPLLILFSLFGGWKKPRLNLSDFIFLGACAGSGFSMLEKYFWDHVYFSFTYGPHLGNVYFFSDALGVYASGEPFGYVGHAASTVFIALGLGLSYELLRTKKLFWSLPALLTFIWISLEHIILNYSYTPHGKAFLIFGGGQWTPWIISTTLLATIVFEAIKTSALLKQKVKVFQKIQHAFKHIKDLPSLVHACSVLRAVNYLVWLKMK